MARDRPASATQVVEWSPVWERSLMKFAVTLEAPLSHVLTCPWST